MSVPDEEEEFDFMSDEFLLQCTQNDVRPGLLHKHGQKRQHEQLKKQEEDKRRKLDEVNAKKFLEETNREAGLSREIASDNKGFKMLEKMGFKPGTSLGRSTEGIKEPIRLAVKQGRGCLGQKTAFQEKRKKLEETADPELFRARILAQSTQREIQRDLHKAQTACRNLDCAKDITEPLISWYWPKLVKVKNPEDEEPEDDEADEQELPEPAEQLEALVNHLRIQYFYCIWCGTAYDDAEDLEQSCPGATGDLH